MEGFARGFYSISEWVMRFMYVNILWILFTFLGLVVFGFFPATTAMFAVVRKWVMKEYDIPVFRTFLLTFKNEFIKSSMIGLFITAFGLLMYSNIHIIEGITVPLLKLLYIPNAILIVILLQLVLYIFPVFVHFDVGIMGVIKNALIFIILNPLQTLYMGASTGFLLLLYYTLPGLIPFFSGSFIAFILMWFSFNAFEKMNKQMAISVR